MKTIRIGRNSDNDIVYSDISVSGSHAEITIKDDGIILLTDHSTNGTMVNGALLHQSMCRVSPSDVIMFPGDNVLNWDCIQGVMPQASPEVDAPKDCQEHNAGNASPNQNAYCGKDDYQAGILSFSLALKDGVLSGLKNTFSLLAIVLLAVLTCWIPYINIGVFIAITTLAPLWAQGKVVNPLEIFDSKYRRVMGDYIIVNILKLLGCLLLLPFTIVPAFVLRYKWMFANCLVVYKDMDFSQALKMSDKRTYGHKWTMFFLDVVCGLLIAGLYLIWSLIAILCVGIGVEDYADFVSYIDIVDYADMLDYVDLVAMAGSMIGAYVVFGLIYLCLASISIGVVGSVWKQLCESND